MFDKVNLSTNSQMYKIKIEERIGGSIKPLPHSIIPHGYEGEKNSNDQRIVRFNSGRDNRIILASLIDHSHPIFFGFETLTRTKVTHRAIFRDVADILFPFGGIFRHGDTSINICAAGTGDHVTRPSATICERGHVRHGSSRVLDAGTLGSPESGLCGT